MLRPLGVAEETRPFVGLKAGPVLKHLAHSLVLWGVLLAFGLLSSPVSWAAGHQAKVEVFGFVETKYPGLKPFPKWRGVIERFEKHVNLAPQNCKYKDRVLCQDASWADLFDRANGKPPAEQLNVVNEYINANLYVLDIDNWGVEDYWETPIQFFAKMGDCEDYAIVKYLTLRFLGWPVEKMQIVVLQDMNLNVTHANLVISHKGEQLVLDNQFSDVIAASRIHHYLPVYAVNEKNWWRFRKAE